eukprot:16432199-Heterocapsa_arctica.AAC.1
MGRALQLVPIKTRKIILAGRHGSCKMKKARVTKWMPDVENNMEKEKRSLDDQTAQESEPL